MATKQPRGGNGDRKYSDNKDWHKAILRSSLSICHFRSESMSTKSKTKNQKAFDILNHLEGTLIADIRSLKKSAIELKDCTNSDFGHLNYTTLLVGLVACETLGMYLNGADLHYTLNDPNKTPDVGSYISRFIENYFPQRDKFKKISKILSDYLRHSLIHGFAPRVDRYPFDINLYVSDGKKYLQPETLEKQKRLTIRIDGISFLTAVIRAFERVQSEAKKKDDLIQKIIKAEKCCLTITPGKDILNQFIASYPSLKKG